jgi:hypothetical protein
MRTATDRIDYWIRRRIVPCDALLPGNAKPGSDRYVGLTAAIGQSLRDQYDALAARVPPHLAALVRQLRTGSSRAEFPGTRDHGVDDVKEQVRKEFCPVYAPGERKR